MKHSRSRTCEVARPVKRRRLSRYLENQTRIQQSESESSSEEYLGSGSSDAMSERAEFECEFCGKQLSCKEHLRNHLLLHGKDRPFKCHLCPSAFVLNDRLVYHLKTVHGVMPYPCNVCNRRFERKKDLVAHQAKCSGVDVTRGATTEINGQIDEVEKGMGDQQVNAERMAEGDGQESTVSVPTEPIRRIFNHRL